jgi:DUF4097 and DUF4098 domain-containing protein YvlB
MVLALVVSTVAYGQKDTVDRVTVELTDPSQPASLQVGLVNGGIKITGYDGKEVIVKATTRLKKVEKPAKGTEKSAGMTRLAVNSSSLTVEEYQNEIEIGTDSWANPIDLEIKVPKLTSLELSCVNSGDIHVENITGDVTASNINGSVTLLNVTGSAVASAHNDNVTVSFIGIDPEKDMSFSSFNGDVDVTFPASIKAKVKLKTVQGDIFTDFEITQIENPERIVEENRRDSGGRYQVKIDRAYWGTINGGGQEIHFENYNGDIYIRKQK